MGRVEWGSLVRPCSGERVAGDAVVIRRIDDTVFAAIVDVLGHGEDAHALALEVVTFLRDSEGLALCATMLALHEHILGTRGAAAGLCSLRQSTGVLRYVGIGNTVIRRFGASDARLVSRPGIIGGNHRSLREEHMRLEAGDVVVLYTDGVRDHFALDEYPQILCHDPETVARTVLHRFGKAHDDSACIALKYAS
jgi:hypothetical protein